jgi:hypothetical protein
MGWFHGEGWLEVEMLNVGCHVHLSVWSRRVQG